MSVPGFRISAKFYVNERDSTAIRAVIRQADAVASSAWQSAKLCVRFIVTCGKAGDAIHLATAREAGEPEIWSNDRHLLAAAAHFGLVGRRA